MGIGVIYRRVSSAEQAKSGLGLEAQEAECRATAARLGLVVASVHTDAGISGAVPLDRRPGLVAALAAVGRGDVLLVGRRDRLARDSLLALVLERDLARRKARLVSAAGEASDDDSPASQLMRRVLDAVSEYERAVGRARSAAAAMARRARGEAHGYAPYGWRAEGGRLVEDRGEQAGRALIVEARAGGASLRQIAGRLTSAGIAPRSGRRWHASAVASILAHVTR